MKSCLVAVATLLALGAPLLRAQPTTAPAAPASAAPASRFQLPATDDGLPGVGPIRRYDWFQRVWIERRTQWAAQASRDQGAIVFLGDSITQGWANALNAYFLGLKVANRGISGDTTRGVLIRLQEDVIALNPRAVVLLIGTNDLEEQATPEMIVDNLKLILAALRQHNPAMPVILCNVFPSSETKKRPSALIKKVNALYFAAIKDQPQVTVLDTWSLFANAQGDAKPEEFYDLLHPNFLGYAKWSSALHPILETLGLAPVWPDEFKPEPGFESLFNGRDLTGWSYRNAPAFDGKTDAPDGRFVVRNNRIVVTTSRLERAFATLWTQRTFAKDFVLKLEFRASPNADSGVFVREPQVQVRDFPIAGPYANLKQYRPLDWNELVIEVRGGLGRASCNGEVFIDAFPVPPSGPIGLESDRGQMEYRRIRIQETR